MRYNKLILLIVLVYFACSSFVLASDDGEYWSMTTFSKKVNDRLRLNLLEQFRMKSEMGNFYTYVQYAGVNYKINNNFDVGVWYKLVSSKNSQDWSESHRVDIDGTVKLDLSGFKISDRSRFERNTTSNSWLYRNRLKCSKTVELFEKDFTPFISNEFFLDLEPSDGFDENRASVGFSTKFIWGTKLALYYMSRAKKSKGNWNNANVIGTTIGFNF